MMQRTVCFALAAIVTGHFAVTGYGQGGVLDRAAAGSQSAARTQAQQRAQAQAQQRAQTQVQQRAQAQVQQRANVQVQQRAQTRLQQRVQGQLGNRVRGAAKNAAGTTRQMRQQQGKPNRLNVNAGANVGAEANAAGNGFATESNVRVNGSGRLVVPGPALRGNGEVNVEYFDNVFGRFNPFRQPESGANDETASPSQRPADRTESTAAAGGSNQGEASANESGSESQQRLSGIGAKQKGALHAQVDLSKAVRLRRSEISAMRDHALATSNAQLMASADQMEQVLDRFMEAQAVAEAQARTTARGAANEPRTPQGGFNASATGQARGRIGGGGTRVAERPEEGPSDDTKRSPRSRTPSKPAARR